jgi:hypothetical protein
MPSDSHTYELFPSSNALSCSALTGTQADDPSKEGQYKYVKLPPGRDIVNFDDVRRHLPPDSLLLSHVLGNGRRNEL